MSEPLVSIIIPTFNRAHLIGETLHSVLAQSYQNWECIVVDDGSVDNTDEVMAEYMAKDARFKYYHRPKDRLAGGNAARNYGFELSKGEYVQWFDSDDLMHPKKLETQINYLEKSNLSFCVCQKLVFEKTIDGILGLKHPLIYSDKPFKDFLMMKIVWMTPSAIWKKSFLQNFSYLFDEELKAAQEWEFQSRILAVESNYIPLDEPLVYIRKHNQSISYSENNSLRIWNYFFARLKIYKQKNLELDFETKKYLQKYLLKHFKHLVPISSLKTNINAYVFYILREDELALRMKLLAFLSILSYFCFNKGLSILKMLRY